MEALHDIPLRQRIDLEQTALQSHQTHQAIIKSTVRRLRNAQKSPRYPTYFSVQPLLSFAFNNKLPDPQQDLPLALDTLLLQLRLLTLMRAGDLAQVPWALYHMTREWKVEDPLFIHTTTKSGTRYTHSIKGKTTKLLLAYAHYYRNYPAASLFRYLNKPSQTLGAERLAKRCLQVMGSLGIDTQVWKSHALWGALATHLAKQGVPLAWIQARGGGHHWRPCSSTTTGSTRIRTGSPS